MDPNLLKAIGTVIAIILVDLALSGDNALVIGAVASKLSGRQRRNAITVGGLIAIILRIGLTFLAVFLLRIPFISILGGIVVFIIAVQLIRDIDTTKEEEAEIEHPTRRAIPSDATFVRAITTIAIADFSMSLDNALAIAALARNNLLLLAIGLLFSIAILLIASAVVASLITRFPVLMYLSGLILAITAGNMILEDQRFKPVVAGWDAQVPGPPLAYMLLGVLVIVFALIALILRNRQNHHVTAAKPV